MEAEDPPDDEGRSSTAITAEDLEQIHDPVVRAKVEYYRQSFEMIRSPLLPPEVLARYGSVVPGLPEKLTPRRRVDRR
jgi:hypothetical protein